MLKEKKLTNTMIIQIGNFNSSLSEKTYKIKIIYFRLVGYLLTWTPYSIVSMYSAFIDPSDISPLASTLPAMFAKSSMVWSTILFIYSNDYIKIKFKN